MTAISSMQVWDALDAPRRCCCLGSCWLLEATLVALLVIPTFADIPTALLSQPGLLLEEGSAAAAGHQWQVAPQPRLVAGRLAHVPDCWGGAQRARALCRWCCCRCCVALPAHACATRKCWGAAGGGGWCSVAADRRWRWLGAVR